MTEPLDYIYNRLVKLCCWLANRCPYCVSGTMMTSRGSFPCTECMGSGKFKKGIPVLSGAPSLIGASYDLNRSLKALAVGIEAKSSFQCITVEDWMQTRRYINSGKFNEEQTKWLISIQNMEREVAEDVPLRGIELADAVAEYRKLKDDGSFVEGMYPLFFNEDGSPKQWSYHHD